MLRKDQIQINKYSNMLNNILNHRSKSLDMNLSSSSSMPSVPLGDVTDSTKLLKFLKITIKDQTLKDKCDAVYKILNPGTTP